MLAALEAAGVVRLTGVSVDTGHDSIAVCELLVEPPWKQKEASRRERLFAQLDRKWEKEKQGGQPHGKDRDTERER
jgi:hypothetical protein